MYFSKRVKMKRLIMIFVLIAGCNQDQTPSSNQSDSFKNIRIKTVHGDILLQLYKDEAPLASERISNLTLQGFYNGLKFHKVITNFIIQTGDPSSTGNGGTGKRLKAEANEISHEVGSVSMARLQNDPNSADSQFFICLSDCDKLNGKYTVFAKVILGLEIARKIQLNDRIIDMSLE